MNQSEVEKLLINYLPPHDLVYCENEFFEELGLKLNISGVAVQIHNGPEVFASSSSIESSALELAAYECLERYIVLKDKKVESSDKSFALSVSNGVAIHTSTEYAKLYAHYELFERHEILKSWYFNTPIEEVPIDLQEHFPKEMISKYKFRIINFSTDVRLKVIGVFAFPYETGLNLVYGFGCGNDLQTAFAKAKKEFFTRFGFLWDQSPSDDSDKESICTSFFHQDFYLKRENHSILWSWLSPQSSQKNSNLNPLAQNISYIDLTPEAWKRDFSVIRAISDNMIPLFFGKAPRETYDFTHRYDIPHPIV